MLPALLIATMLLGAAPQHTQDGTLLCRFVGRFVKVGLPDEPVTAIPLNLIDPNFVLVVHVDAVQEGRVPEGWDDEIAFAIHSPALFFGSNGIEPPGFDKAPAGSFGFRLSRRPDDQFVLRVEPASGADLAPSSQVLRSVAQRYYALLDAAEAQEAPARERSQQALWKVMKGGDVEIAAEATGIVVDLESQPVAGAQVEVEGGTSTEHGATGEDGTFRIALRERSGRMLSLAVTAPGFDRWAFTGFYGGVQGERVQLSRTLSRDLLAATVREPQPERRVWRLLETVGDRPGSTLDPVEVFADLGALRPDLRALVTSRAFERKDDINDAPADRARRLLAWWADPADAGLLAGWLEKQREFRAVPHALAAASEAAMCSQWAQQHFQREGVASNPPWHICSAVVTDPSGTRMLLRFEVRYAYWGYSQFLVAVREAGAWHLRRVVDGEHYHMRPG